MEGMEDKLNALLNSPGAMEKVMGMARALGGSPKEPTGAQSSIEQPAAESEGLGGLFNSLSDIDPAILAGVMKLVNEYTRQGDEKEALFMALKPYLREERREKMDRAAKIIKLARTAKTGYQTFFGGEK